MSALSERIKRIGRDRREPVDVPEWDAELDGKKLHVRCITMQERDDYENYSHRINAPGEPKECTGLMVKLVIAATVDGQGAPVFGEEDFAWLQASPAAPVTRLFNKACEMAGMGGEEARKTARNFGSPSSSATSTTSPATSASGT